MSSQHDLPAPAVSGQPDAESRSAGPSKTRPRLLPFIGGIASILVALLAGELLHAVGIPVPASVIGMVLLALGLGIRLVKPETVRPAANTLTRNMSVLFVPAGVGVMAYADLLRRSWLPIAVAVIASTAVVLVLVGPLQRFLHSLRVPTRRGKDGAR